MKTLAAVARDGVTPASVLCWLLGAVIVLPVFALSLTPAASATFAPNDLTIGRAHELFLAFEQYVQDNNESFPPMSSAAAFDAAVAPYVHDPNAYYSADTGQPFVPNASLNGKQVSQENSAATTPIFQDEPAGQSAVVAFLDGHVEYGGVQTGDPVQISISRARALAMGVEQYTEDYDETLPGMATQSLFETELEPYVRAPLDFTDNLTSQFFVPNGALSGVAYRSISQNPATVPVVTDSTPAADGLTTTAYLDGHAAHGAAVQPAASNSDNISFLGLAIAQYEQDNNDMLPPLNTEAAFEAALMPYLTPDFVFLSPVGLPYRLNGDLSGMSLNGLADPSQAWVLADPVQNSDGSLNTLNAVGRVETVYAFIPVALATGQDNYTRLVWGKANGAAAISILSPIGNRLAYQSYAAGTGPEAGFAVAPDATARYVFNLGNGSESLQSVSSGGSLLAASGDGPYDGWTPLGVTVTNSDQTLLLWQRYDETTALEYFTSGGVSQNTVVDAAPSGFQAIAVASGAAGDARVLFGNGAGSIMLWDDLPSGPTTTNLPTQDYTPVALAVGPDDRSHILLKKSTGGVMALTVPLPDANRPIICPSLMNWTAVGLSVDTENNTHLLWRSTLGTACIRTYSPRGSLISVQTYPAPP